MKHVWLLPLAYLLGLTACDKSCHSPVNAVVNIDNRTGRSLNLSICQGEATSAPAHLYLAPAQTGALMVGQNDNAYTASGPSAQCSRANGAPVATGIALTTQSFTDVKLCWSAESRSKVAIVEKAQGCPAGYQEQTTPVDSCNPTVIPTSPASS